MASFSSDCSDPGSLLVPILPLGTYVPYWLTIQKHGLENAWKSLLCAWLMVSDLLLAHETAIGDTIAAIGPYSMIASRGQLELRHPPLDTLSLPRFGWFCPEFGGKRDALQYLKIHKAIDYSSYSIAVRIAHLDV